MHPFPHHYSVVATGDAGPDADLNSGPLPTLPFAAPAEFDGPGNRWSPETLVVAAIAGCFVLTFRAIAAASKLPWTSLACDVAGTVDRVDRVTQFTRFDMRARLRIPPGSNAEQALRLMHKAEQTCLVTNSLKATFHLDATVEVDERAS
jgi:organic hydroperoxide reductase OsmC/OhrA